MKRRLIVKSKCVEFCDVGLVSQSDSIVNSKVDVQWCRELRLAEKAGHGLGVQTSQSQRREKQMRQNDRRGYSDGDIDGRSHYVGRETAI